MPQAPSPSPAARAAHIVVFLAACAVALFNGTLSSPIYDSISQLMYLATRGYPLMTAARADYATLPAIAVMTLLIAGIPAAIYERIRGLQTSSWVSMLIWLVATVLLSLPTILNAMGG